MGNAAHRFSVLRPAVAGVHAEMIREPSGKITADVSVRYRCAGPLVRGTCTAPLPVRHPAYLA
jgi:hypothetical protein